MSPEPAVCALYKRSFHAEHAFAASLFYARDECLYGRGSELGEQDAAEVAVGWRVEIDWGHVELAGPC